jgi:uncharacterized protein YqjF (DUF2071 family)
VTVESITLRTPRPVGRGVLVQWWRELTFLHWPVDPARVAHLFPPGTRPDTLGGVTYVGLVPFQMHRVRLPPEPGVPYFRTFYETNVRLYSVDDTGRRGVVFRSLDAARLLPVLIGRSGARLPYSWSTMRLHRQGDQRVYTCRRRWPGRATSRIAVTVGRPITHPTELERFLTARWGLHVSWYGRTLYLPNEHEPWPLHQATLHDLDDGLIAAAGLPQPTEPPVSVLYSPGVAVRIGTPFV